MWSQSLRRLINWYLAAIAPLTTKLLKFLRRLLEADAHTFYQCIYFLVKCVVIHCECD